MIEKYRMCVVMRVSGMRIDFHGLQVNEVVHYMDQIFKIARQSPSRKRITIVTGSGMHSYLL